jgi:hypothetical protein
MGLEYQASAWQRLLLSLAFAALAAGIFSVVVLVRDAALESQLRKADNERAELRARDMDLEHKLRRMESERAKLEVALQNEKEEKRKLAFQTKTAATAAKVAGGVLVCTVLWDMTAFLGNPFAIPGLVDNAVCGALAGIVGVVTNPSSSTEDTAVDVKS